MFKLRITNWCWDYPYTIDVQLLREDVKFHYIGGNAAPQQPMGFLARRKRKYSKKAKVVGFKVRGRKEAIDAE